LKQRNAAVAALSTDLNGIKADVAEKEQETARLKDELLGLSTVYKTLESEYNTLMIGKPTEASTAPDSAPTADSEC
jgi:hypothetical protein